MEIVSKSEKETYDLARDMGMKAKAGDVISLNGDLGAGKTVFASGFANGLGVYETINSPTFTIINEYEDGRLPFYHFDVYRIDDPDEIYETGIDEYIFSDGVCIIEWGEKIKDILPDDTKNITIEKMSGQDINSRKIIIEEK